MVEAMVALALVDQLMAHYAQCMLFPINPALQEPLQSSTPESAEVTLWMELSSFCTFRQLVEGLQVSLFEECNFINTLGVLLFRGDISFLPLCHSWVRRDLSLVHLHQCKIVRHVLGNFRFLFNLKPHVVALYFSVCYCSVFFLPVK